MMPSSTPNGWISRAGRLAARYVFGICTGSLLLGAAGLLRGRRASSHWRARELLSRFGAIPSDERMCVDGHIYTAGGVTSGIDMGLRVVADLCGEDVAKLIQLQVEYDPEPPFPGGTPKPRTRPSCSATWRNRRRASRAGRRRWRAPRRRCRADGAARPPLAAGKGGSARASARQMIQRQRGAAVTVWIAKLLRMSFTPGSEQRVQQEAFVAAQVRHDHLQQEIGLT